MDAPSSATRERCRRELLVWLVLDSGDYVRARRRGGGRALHIPACFGPARRRRVLSEAEARFRRRFRAACT